VTAPIILHHDADSPGSIRARKAMALKSLVWKSHVLDGDAAERWRRAVGTPTALQLGAEFHVGAEAILDLLEEVSPDPTFFPNGNRGMPLALAFWSAEFYRIGSAKLAAADERGAIEATISQAGLIERQLADGRDYLQGPLPGIADLEAYSAISALARRGLDCGPLFAACPHIRGWHDRLDALGEGEPDSIGLDECRAALKTAAGDAEGLTTGAKRSRLRCLGEDLWVEVNGLRRPDDHIEAQLGHPDFGALRVRYLAAFVEIAQAS